MDQNRIQRLVDAFAVFDSSKSGKCKTEELLSILRVIGPKPLTAQEAKEFVADADDGGYVDYEKFVRNVMFAGV